MHFAVFLEQISNNHEVVLFVDESISKFRINQGWKVPKTGKTKIFINKDINFIKGFIDKNQNSYLIFSSIHSIKSCELAFKYAVKKNERLIGIISEGHKSNDLKMPLRIIRSRFFYFKYRKKIKFIFAMGNIGVNWFVNSGFSKKIVYHWSYFVDNKNILGYSRDRKTERRFSLIFVGQLIARKRILELLDVVKDITDIDINIIGDGILRKKVQEFSDYYENINYLGVLENPVVLKKIKNSDLLILPSKFDGWGAVTNESLQLGTPVLCTDTCGSSVLVDGNIRGESFKWSKEKLRELILKWKVKEDLEYKRNIIIKWSDNLSVIRATNYFIDVLKNILKKNKIEPKAPWIQAMDDEL